MKPLSSRLKIALLSAGISGLVLVTFALLMWMQIAEMRVQALDRELRSLATRHPGLFAGRGNYERLTASLEFTFGTAFTNRVMMSLQDSAGRLLYRSPNRPAGLTLDEENDAGQAEGIAQDLVQGSCDRRDRRAGE